LSITCGPDYPQKAPQIKFNNKVNIPCVNQGNGNVENLAVLKGWKQDCTLEKVLLAIKKEMSDNKKLPQPAEGASY